MQLAAVVRGVRRRALRDCRLRGIGTISIQPRGSVSSARGPAVRSNAALRWTVRVVGAFIGMAVPVILEAGVATDPFEDHCRTADTAGDHGRGSSRSARR